MAVNVNNHPDLKFSFSGGNLMITDMLEEYDDIDVSEYICLEYLVIEDKMVNVTIREDIQNIKDLEHSIIMLDKDGLYTYYRMLRFHLYHNIQYQFVQDQFDQRHNMN